MAEDCIFCKIVAGEIPSFEVAQSERAYAFADINPATRGHALVIPRAHSADIHEIAPEDLSACALLAKDVAARARERLGAAGVNLLHSAGASAWQTVFHFHIHVIPRYDGDPLRLPWTPAPGDLEEISRPRLSCAVEIDQTARVVAPLARDIFAPLEL